MTRNDLRAVLPLLVATALLALGTAGCSKEPPSPQPVIRKPVPKEQARPSETAKPAETPKESESVVFYNPADKRDPFIPFLKKEEAKVAGPRVAPESLPPLQRYELAEFRFVGVIWGRKGARALVEDNEGKGYSVTVGTRIGRGGGVVTRITDGEIFVKEEFRDYTGSTVVRENSLKLQTAGGK